LDGKTVLVFAGCKCNFTHMCVLHVNWPLGVFVFVARWFIDRNKDGIHLELYHFLVLSWSISWKKLVSDPYLLYLANKNMLKLKIKKKLHGFSRNFTNLLPPLNLLWENITNRDRTQVFPTYEVFSRVQ
jgi:hypothetical protein